ncbi:hypothetical protein SLE2022_007550 [Rubroshorea leprosula]
MKPTEITAMKSNINTATQSQQKSETSQKPYFRPAKDDTKPVLQDPIVRSDPIETEEAVLRLPPFPAPKSS